MKNSILVLLTLIPFLLAAQSGTTLEEYRFLSKGYAYQQSMGLDASKQGYIVQPIAPATPDVEYIGLFAEGHVQPQGILLILHANTEQPVYLCLPNNQADNRVKELFTIDKENIKSEATLALYNKAMHSLVFYLLENQMANTYAPAKEMTTSTESTTNTTKVKVVDENWYEESNTTTVSSSNPTEVTPEEYSFTEKGGTSLAKQEINTAVAISMDESIALRGVLNAPVIKGEYMQRGKVAIKFCVDKTGTVTSAKFTQRGSNTFNKNLIRLAIESINDAAFAENEAVNECGVVVFHFQ